jgi:phospholipase/carboxylesterase
MLKYEIRPASGDRAQAPLIILMHGRGATRSDLVPLGEHMPAHANVVFPEAPFEAAQWGYGPGSAWYRFLGHNRPEPASFARSLDELQQLIAQLNAPKVVVGGFSQGGTLGLGYALSLDRHVDGVLNFSGFLADHPEVDVSAEAVADTSFFWGHGRQDPAIPFELALEGRAALQAAGAKLEAHDYDIGHWIAPEELTDALGFLNSLL